MSRRKFSTHIKSLVHFDYPYFNEPYDGCRDEIAGNIYIRRGNAKFVGTEIPCDEIVEGTPKFGYRCLQTAGNDDYISREITDTLSIYETECFVRITSSASGNIFTANCRENNGIILSKNSDNKIVFAVFESGSMSSLVSSKTLALNTWHHVKLKVSGTDVSIYIDGEECGSKNFAGLCPQDLSAVNIGGITGQIDEFVLRDVLSENKVPSEPYQGWLDISQLGGYGEGTSGITASSGGYINSYANVSDVSGRKITLTDITQGKYADFTSGSEIMLHVTSKRSSKENLLGLYAFRKITELTSNVLTLDSEVSEEFSLSSAVNDYYVQAIAIPSVKNFTIPRGTDIHPKPYDINTGGGIVIIRASGNITLSGRILTSGYGPLRDDLIQMTHADLPERFLPNLGGGIILICGGTLTAGATAKIGALWNGSLKGGKPVNRLSGQPGGAGYGGAGGSSWRWLGLGGAGGVGGGGGGAIGAVGGDAGSASPDARIKGAAGTGGGNGEFFRTDNQHPPLPSDGGTAGIMLNSLAGPSTTGGGGAGGNAAAGAAAGVVTPSGACVLIAARKIKLDLSALSTGGGGGGGGDMTSCGGGGTGFAYIACEEMI